MDSQATVDMTLYNQIQELYLRCFQESSKHHLMSANAVKYILQLLSQFDVLVEYRNNRVVGCIIYQKYFNILLGDNECYVHEWFIDPKYRKKSIGMRLYTKLCSKALELGCVRMRGFSSNEDMIRTIVNHRAAKVTAQMFEKELVTPEAKHGRT